MKNRILSLGLVPVFVGFGVSAALVIGCGDSEATGQTTPTDATVETALNPSPPDAAAASDASTTKQESGFDIVGALPDGSLRDCAVCIRDQCGTLLTDCFNDPACSQGVTCTVTTCFPMPGTAMGDSGLDLSCVTGCFMGNLPAAVSAVGGVMCISTSCGETCRLVSDAGNGTADTGSNPTDGDTDAGSNAADAGSE